jgi:phosphoglycerate dehydrogenase-like enzyme
VLRIVVLDDYQDVARSMAPWDRLSAAGGSVSLVVLRHHVADLDELARALAGADVVVAMRERTPFGASEFARLPDLKLLVTTGMANASIDLAAAAAAGVTVCGTGGVAVKEAPVSSNTAELTWGLVLALARHLPEEDRNVREGRWQTTVGTDLQGSVLGVLGLGRLGAQVARIGQAFGMSVVAWSENLTAEACEAAGVRHVTKQQLFAISDVVTIHQVLSSRTRGLVGAPELATMKPTALLINTSRGPIVDEAALVAALADGTIAGAGLDVFDVEPLPADHPLRSAPNTVLTPHLGYVTRGAYQVMYDQAVDDIVAWRAGDPVRVLQPR